MSHKFKIKMERKQTFKPDEEVYYKRIDGSIAKGIIDSLKFGSDRLYKIKNHGFYIDVDNIKRNRAEFDGKSKAEKFEDFYDEEYQTE